MRDAALVAALAAFALAYGLLVAHKTRAFAAACVERGVRAEGVRASAGCLARRPCRDRPCRRSWPSSVWSTERGIGACRRRRVGGSPARSKGGPVGAWPRSMARFAAERGVRGRQPAGSLARRKPPRGENHDVDCLWAPRGPCRRPSAGRRRSPLAGGHRLRGARPTARHGDGFRPAPRRRPQRRTVARFAVPTPRCHGIVARGSLGAGRLGRLYRRRAASAGPTARPDARARWRGGGASMEPDAHGLGRDARSARPGARREFGRREALASPPTRPWASGPPCRRACHPTHSTRGDAGQYGRSDARPRRCAGRPQSRVPCPSSSHSERRLGAPRRSERLATDRRGLPRAPLSEPQPTPRPFPEGPIRPPDVLEPRPVRMDSSASRVHPQHVLAVYAESLVAGARVAVFGDASIGLAARLSEQGAHAVHVWDPDSTRARAEAEHAVRGVSVRAYSSQDSEIRPVDMAIVADLGLFSDPATLIARVRRMVGEDGVAVLAANSTEVGRRDASHAFDYYELFDLVAAEFQTVRMVAQLPFFGVALVELGEQDESTAVNVDTQLGESGKARSPRRSSWSRVSTDARLDPYSIVQLPSSPREVAIRRGRRGACAGAASRPCADDPAPGPAGTEMAGARARGRGMPALEESLRGRTTCARAELERELTRRRWA